MSLRKKTKLAQINDENPNKNGLFNYCTLYDPLLSLSFSKCIMCHCGGYRISPNHRKQNMIKKKKVRKQILLLANISRIRNRYLTCE